MKKEQPVILVVEDDEAIRRIVSKVLEAEGYRTELASNGAEGLEKFYLCLPDLIMMDVRMPQMDGWEALERLRRVSECLSSCSRCSARLTTS